jgi:hypothetical protein
MGLNFGGMDFEEDGAIALDKQGIFWVIRHLAL